MNKPNMPSRLIQSPIAETEGLTAPSLIVEKLTNIFGPFNSMIDIGCQNGAFLFVFQDGTKKILGIDVGSKSSEELLIPLAQYQSLPLGKVSVTCKYDICISLDFAQKIPISEASVFVQNLCDLGDLIYFSAAAPGQPPSSVNPQWPSFWQALFEQNGFQAYDLIGRSLWNDSRVDWRLLQNSFILVRETRTDLVQQAKTFQKTLPDKLPYDVIHPRAFEEYHYLQNKFYPPFELTSARAALRFALIMTIRALGKRKVRFQNFIFGKKK